MTHFGTDGFAEYSWKRLVSSFGKIERVSVLDDLPILELKPGVDGIVDGVAFD